MTNPQPSPLERFAKIRKTMQKTAQAVNRDVDEITLVAVSKQQPFDRVEPVLAAGQTVFGENRVQEAQERWQALESERPRLRLIGPLQSNKAQAAVTLFDAIETLDRDNLAKALAKAVQAAGRAPEIFVQINTGEEPQKSGVTPDQADAFIDKARRTLDLPVSGLMCIPPIDEEPAMHFALLADIARRNGLSGLSMGMSDDYVTAIRFGAHTHSHWGCPIWAARMSKPSVIQAR